MSALNRFPFWKYALMLVILIFGLIYALPNLYVPDPAIQITVSDLSANLDAAQIKNIQGILTREHLEIKSMDIQPKSMLIKFNSTDIQLKAKDILQSQLGEQFIVAINLASSTPTWLERLGASPMKLGLDLRGGLNFLYEVDADSVIEQRIAGDLHNISQTLRDKKIRYTDLNRISSHELKLSFKTPDAVSDAFSLLTQQFRDFNWEKSDKNPLEIHGVLLPAALFSIHQDIMEQAMNTLRNRVNELGVSEAVVQQQGSNRIAVDLPGVQDSAQAKNVLGETATLEFHLQDLTQTQEALGESRSFDWRGHAIALKNQIILRGSSIISARSSVSDEGVPMVEVRLGGSGDPLFTKMTAENVGKPLAVLYVKVKATPISGQGDTHFQYRTEKRVISVATINSALGSAFQITGLGSVEEAKHLALMLRAGSLPAPLALIEERQIGPSLGKQNIEKGIWSVSVGMIIVMIFMMFYYRVFGILANLALMANLILIVAIMSLIGATMTLAGMAGLVLTVSMAIDANVLIFERIREELRRGLGVQASIHAGYERAFTTIFDANMTTLIVTFILFYLGSGVVKGFAITLLIGVLTSMLTAIVGTRALVNLCYGSRNIKRISIGI